jgi:DNA-binding response OmpR family regulator
MNSSVVLSRVEVDLDGYQLRSDKSRIPLTSREHDVLELLMCRRGESVSREQILNQIWGHEVSVGHSNVDNVVARLRAKLGRLDGNTTWIATVHGTGYRWSR